MRHRLKTNNLNRTSEHRLALMRNMAINLFTWGPEEIEAKAKRGRREARQPYRHFLKPYQIKTTLQKAKACRPFIEKCITLAKKGELHHRRMLIARLGGTATAKRIAKKLIEEIAPKFANRNGGYTRIIRLPKLTRPVSVENHLLEDKKRSRFLGTRLGDNAELCLLELVEFDGEQPQAAMSRVLPEGITAEQEKTGE